MLIDIIVSVILAAVIGGAITCVVLSKKRGETCVGCPYAKECAKRKCGGCGTGHLPTKSDGDHPSEQPK